LRRVSLLHPLPTIYSRSESDCGREVRHKNPVQNLFRH
jgi:hypothetical protein